MNYIDEQVVQKNMGKRIKKNSIGKWLFFIATLIGLVFLAALAYRILTQGIGGIDWQFLSGFTSASPERAGIKAGVVGSLWLMAVTAPVTIILGVSTAIYLEEYAKQNRLTRFIQTNIQNLAGVPSIVFGLLGLTIFVYVFGIGEVILSGGLTLALLVLPVITVAAQEAIRSVPQDVRQASFALGATKWQTVRRVVLPAAIPGILTGSILALSRAIGETAPLLVVGASTAIFTLPGNINDPYTAMPIQIFSWTQQPQQAFQDVASAGIVILLAILLLMNFIAVMIRNKFSKRF
ncbi:phosphate ABC transporter permease PstA [Pontibacillus yanchengensis]|uniref:Phosphate ABC transporter permease PstA n=2 Tax=Pontibacillus yanchengensis TaxID=462910 RepID=A0ACC7VFN7_9BACI|nr:phosphate ABC transporter permease PstA [Pontibacillus yanchengensis]MYL33462.1 phosphate ABC transporter permease PstA [Pontibacillus yanchengensis]MYL53512.1 phosphate ABC transporter permease PstA [Pontibacillus yanchengensis]